MAKMTDKHIREVRLRFTEGENEGIEIRLEVPREVIIGRGEECDIYLGEKKISRRHAKLITSSDKLALEDMGSTNGTFVNENRIEGSCQILEEDSIRIGASIFKVEFHSDEQSSQKNKKSTARKPIEEKEPSLDDAESIPSLDQTGFKSEVSSEKGTLSFGEIDFSSDKSHSQVKEVDEDRSSVVSADIDIDFASEPKPVDESNNDDDEIEVEIEGEDFAEEALPEVSGSQSRKRGVSGNLADMPLSDLLQTFNNSKKSGMLKLSGKSKGQLYLEDGRVIYAYTDNGVTGQKAFMRVLTWDHADFELVSLPKSFKGSKKLGEKLDLSIENLLMEGFRQLDELEKLSQNLPSSGAVLVLNSQLKNPLSKLHPRVLDILQIIIEHKKYGIVLDKSSTSDLDTAKIVFYLLKKAYIVVENGKK